MKAKSGKVAFACMGLLVCFAILSAISQESMGRPAETRHVLFVGDSFTHGRYLPVRTYNNTPGTGGLDVTLAARSTFSKLRGETVAEGDESRPEKHAGPCASDN